MQLTKIHRERAVDAVYSALRHEIISNGITPGQRLNVEDLAAGLGVSLTPVRGAIQRLASEGLVEIRPRSGTFVMSLSADDIRDTFQVCSALGCLAAEQALPRLTPDHLRTLRHHLHQLRRTPRTVEERATYRRHLSDFHELIIAVSGNRRLHEICEAMWAHLRMARMHSQDEDVVKFAGQIYADHEAIVAALEAHDLQRATEAVRRRMEHARGALLGALFGTSNSAPSRNVSPTETSGS